MKNKDFEKIFIDYFLAQKDFWKVRVKPTKYGYDIKSFVDDSLYYNLIYISGQRCYKNIINWFGSQKPDKNKCLYVLNANCNIESFEQVFGDYWFFIDKKTNNKNIIEVLSDIEFKKIDNESKKDMLCVIEQYG